jgi:methylenetetrahydrofolate--tRNA-(uracil-5-)-methyltransferase
MNANFGLFPELPIKIKGKQERNLQHANRALEKIQNFMNIL